MDRRPLSERVCRDEGSMERGSSTCSVDSGDGKEYTKVSRRIMERGFGL